MVLIVTFFTLITPLIVSFSDRSFWSYKIKYAVVILIQMLLGVVIGYGVFIAFHASGIKPLANLLIIYSLSFGLFSGALFTIIYQLRIRTINPAIVSANVGALLVTSPTIILHTTGFSGALEAYENAIGFKLIGISSLGNLKNLIAVVIICIVFGILGYFYRLLRSK